MTGRGDRCSLCGKIGGLEEVLLPPPTNPERGSWAPASGLDAGTSLATGCLAMAIGMVLGTIIAFGLPADEPAQAGNAAAPPGENCGLPIIPYLFGRLLLGMGLGAISGGFVFMVLVILLSRMVKLQRGEQTRGQ